MHEITTEGRKEIEVRLTQFARNRTEIVLAYLHGSFLEGAFRDIDIAVFLTEIVRSEALHYELDMENELDRLISLPFDVRVLNHAPLSFRFNVVKTGILLLSRDEGIRSDFESLTIVEYHDFDFLRRIYRREAIGIEV